MQEVVGLFYFIEFHTNRIVITCEADDKSYKVPSEFKIERPMGRMSTENNDRR
jgi:hypothetical protein